MKHKNKKLKAHTYDIQPFNILVILKSLSNYHKYKLPSFTPFFVNTCLLSTKVKIPERFQ